MMTTTTAMAQPSFVPKSGSDVCVTMTGHLDDDIRDDVGAPGKGGELAAPALPSRGRSTDSALTALLSLSSAAVAGGAGEASRGGRGVDENRKGRSDSFDDKLVERVTASNRARQSQLMPPPAPMIVKVKVPRPAPRAALAAAAAAAPGDRRRGDLVQRCAKFTAALKEAHPPGSPVFTLFKAFVTHGRDDVERRQVILELVDLLRPDPRLLRLFYGLLPSWVFKRGAPHV